jgi:flagellar motor switch protein FliN/FliY
MQEADNRELKEFLNDLFSKSLGQSISGMTGEEVQVRASQPFEPADSMMWFQWNLKPAEFGGFWFGGPKEKWYELGKAILYGGEAGDDDDGLIVSTLTEIASQVAGSITTFLNAQYRKQIETGIIGVEADLQHATAPAHTSFHQVQFANGSVLPVSFSTAQSLFESLIPVKQQPETLPATLSADTKKLDLLLDVEMPVSISIGRAQLPLKEVVRLTTGSVIELSRNVSEPVDIVVNNCIVARGDVVVVDGNFGVRIREVLSREDRMRRLTAS